MVGPSGSGKTTILRCLAGLERASGLVRVNDTVWQDDRAFLPPERRRVGFVFQGANLLPHLSVSEIASAPMRLVTSICTRCLLLAALRRGRLLLYGTSLGRPPQRPVPRPLRVG